MTLEGPAAELAATDEVQRALPRRRRRRGVAPVDAAEPADARATAHAQRAARSWSSDLTVRFGGIAALDDVSLRPSRPARCTPLIGPNGAGKSTLLNVLTGVYRAAAGTVRYGDDDAHRPAPARIAALGVSRDVPEPRAVARRSTVRGEPAARPPPADGGGLRERRPAAAAGAPRARPSSARVVASIAGAASGSSDQLGAPVPASPYGDRKRVELAPRAVRGAVAAAARRAGRRDERRRVARDGRGDRAAARDARASRSCSSSTTCAS